MAKSKPKKAKKKLSLTNLHEGIGNITPPVCQSMAEAAAVCLENQRHSAGVVLVMSGVDREAFEMDWTPTTQKVRLTWSDIQDATEQGACGITFLLVREITEYTVIERSVKGTGFDYWLGFADDDLFQGKARLEISGILSGDDAKITARVRKKLGQTNKSDNSSLPAYVAVVEFGRPAAKVVQK